VNLQQRERLTTALSGRYAVEHELGQGGMAIVYRARDMKHDRLVAIKVFKPELAHALGPDRFLREIRVTAQLSHPHILPLLDSGEAAGLLYYVMPYVEGESLRQRLERERTVPLDEALRITREVADGLESAHRRGVIHRDIKPENILLEEGHAVIADFGIARAVAESADERLTATGIAVGTPDYMSPEQMLGGRAGPIDARTDVYALACVLHELLTGEPPRRSAVGPVLPEGIDRAVRRALSEAPEVRFDSAAAFIAALPHAGPEADLGSVARLVRRPAYAIPAGVLILLVILAIFLPGRSRAARERGRELLARATLFADSGRYAQAYAALTEAERLLPADSAVARLMPTVADILTVTSEPAGARVYAQRFAPEAADRPADSVLLGETPIRERRMVRGDYRVLITKERFVPVATPASVHGSRPQRNGFRTGQPISIAVRLTPADSAPAQMVLVPGGVYRLSGPKMPLGLEARLDDYFIDTYEVSNEQYKAFVASGGYRRPELARFADRSGMPGPRGWSGQEYPPGRARYPVTDVSWLEASAYCAAAGKRLPTVFEWEKAARNGLAATTEGVMMPWGYVGPGSATSMRANFGSSGPAPVDAYPFGISTYGAYNMAGNVKEWTANPLQNGYGITGGSWEDPIYLYSTYGALAPGASSPSLGFRCARVAGPAAPGHDQGAFRITVETRTPHYTPVAEAEFPALLAHYRYDNRPLESQVFETTVTPDWTRQKVRYVALEGDTALAYLYLPKQATSPFQTMVYVASSGAFAQVRTVPEEVEWAIAPNIRAGRAALAIVFKGMAERAFGPAWEPPPSSSVRFRDLMVLHATELRRGLDYLATRDDIDTRRLAYVAVSWGAGSRLPLAAVDDRFRAVVLIGGGIDERIQPTLPEAANFNFAPYIRAPKLLLNGRDDEEHPWFTRALPLWNLLREPKQLVLVPGGGHVPPLEARVPAINRFLDRTLGSVRRRP
jgi:formylglycine-generating enzyme required for sulfatase activity/tRNA A-37 threonylcarbamoyl transferase component Bud32/pimeloyl-ACP methyl ester carboxylesterase